MTADGPSADALYFQLRHTGMPTSTADSTSETTSGPSIFAPDVSTMKHRATHNSTKHTDCERDKRFLIALFFIWDKTKGAAARLAFRLQQPPGFNSQRTHAPRMVQTSRFFLSTIASMTATAVMLTMSRTELSKSVKWMGLFRPI